MRICMLEACRPEDRGSVGCQYVTLAARAAGYDVRHVTPEEPGGPWDVELVSLHHCTDIPRLAALPRLAPLRIVGGHPLAANPRPAVPYADALCLGEGETWIVEALRRIEHGQPLSDLPGTIVAAEWEPGAELPEPNAEPTVPDHPPYLNRAAHGHAATWYIEAARGCPHRCAYCELGWTLPYRWRPTSSVLAAIREVDAARSRRVSIMAPDASSHPGYREILEAIRARGLHTHFASMRLERAPSLPLAPNMLVRVGIDGLSERLRYAVGRRISDAQIVDYFRAMTRRGHTNFKVFMIFAYPDETAADWAAWERLMAAVLTIPRRVNAHLRIKWTPLIPQGRTPLAGATPRYDPAMTRRIRDWHARVERPYRHPGWYVRLDGLMGARSHAYQVRLAGGDEGAIRGQALRATA